MKSIYRDNHLDSTIMPDSSKEHVKSVKQEIFDSGILSETNLTSSISDINVDCDSTSDKNEVLSMQVELSNVHISSKKDSMKIDSGIDIDITDKRNSKGNCVDLNKNISNESYIDYASIAEDLVKEVKDNSWESWFLQDEDGNTPLHLAILQRNENLINFILRTIPSFKYLDIRNFYFQTSLHLSVLLNQPHVSRLLFLAGADCGFEDRNGDTALHIACKTKNFGCVKALLDPVTLYEQKYTNFKYRPQIYSVYDYINEYNYDGLACVHIAADNNDVKILGQLFMCGADVNIRECKGGYTILHNVVQSGNVNLINFILQHSGIDIDRKNYARLTAYQLSYHYPNIGKLLLRKGAEQLPLVEDVYDDDSEYSEDSDFEE